MKLITMGIVASSLLFVACGKNEQKNTQSETAQVFAEDVMSAEMKSSVPTYIIARVNNETGVVETVTTNEAVSADAAAAGKDALATSEAKAFANGKAVEVLQGDDDLSESSSQSFFWGRRGLGFGYGRGFGGGWGYARPFYNWGNGYGFRYGYLGGVGFNNWNYYRFGVNQYCGTGFAYPYYYGYPAYNYYGYY